MLVQDEKYGVMKMLAFTFRGGKASHTFMNGELSCYNHRQPITEQREFSYAESQRFPGTGVTFLVRFIRNIIIMA